VCWSSVVPSVSKSAYITLLLQRADLDIDPCSWRQFVPTVLVLSAVKAVAWEASSRGKYLIIWRYQIFCRRCWWCLPSSPLDRDGGFKSRLNWLTFCAPTLHGCKPLLELSAAFDTSSWGAVRTVSAELYIEDLGASIAVVTLLLFLASKWCFQWLSPCALTQVV